MSIILFSGIHGVGKNFFLNKLDRQQLSYAVYTASELIGRYQAPTDAGYKKVSNVESNQNVLLRAINEVVEECQKDIILDGHLCVFNAIGDVERIPWDFFEKVELGGIILLQDEPKTIGKRLASRDTKSVKLEDLARMQEEETAYAKELADRLHIEYEIISHDCTSEQFVSILNRMGE